MRDSEPVLDDEALAQLRDAIAEVKTSPGIGRAALARLASVTPSGLALTIDFKAAEVLGQPLVILRPKRELPDYFEQLTAREKEVAGLVAAGLRNKDIALALGISVGTVKDHVRHILDKSGLDGRAAVAATLADAG